MLSWTSSSILPNLLWIGAALGVYAVMAILYRVNEVREGYHGTHRVRLVQQPNGLYEWEVVRLRPVASWDFGDSDTVSLFRSGRVPEWDGEASYLA